MKVNIVTVSSGWILQKIAERTASGNKCDGVTMTVSHCPDWGADVNYYVDLQNCYCGSKTHMDVAYFTHADQNSKEWLANLLFRSSSMSLGGIVCMNKRYEDMLVDIGYPQEKIRTIVPGQTYDMFPLKTIKIGIVSRGGYPNFKGYGGDFLKNLFTKYNTDGFVFKFLGSGWNEIGNIAKEHNTVVDLCEDENYDNYPAFYHGIDYLLVPGLWTAGPISTQEALSTGIPIISADVGFAGYEFEVDYMFPPGDCVELYKILQDVRQPMLDRRAQVEGMTWESYARQLVEFFNYLEDL